MTYGAVASTPESRKLDKTVKEAAALVAKEYKDNTNLSFAKAYKGTKTKVGFTPDGGLFFLDGELILAVEAKKQNKEGNAIERWYKNHFIVRELNPTASYLTFGCGSGATETAVIGRTLSWAHPDGFNSYNHRKNSCYLSTDGYTVEEVAAVIRTALDTFINE